MGAWHDRAVLEIKNLPYMLDRASGEDSKVIPHVFQLSVLLPKGNSSTILSWTPNADSPYRAIFGGLHNYRYSFMYVEKLHLITIFDLLLMILQEPIPNSFFIIWSVMYDLIWSNICIIYCIVLHCIYLSNHAVECGRC